MASPVRHQAEVIADFFQELGYETEIINRYPNISVILQRPLDPLTKAEREHLMGRSRGENVADIVVDEFGNIMIDWDKPKGFVKTVFEKAGLGKYVVSDEPKFKTLEVRGKRWFARGAGNTYHTAQIVIDGKTVHKTPRAYGYGEQYVQSATEWLVANGHLSPIWQKRPLWQLRDYGVHYEAGAEDVPRQKDL
jgi:hypothetical protein